MKEYNTDEETLQYRVICNLPFQHLVLIGLIGYLSRIVEETKIRHSQYAKSYGIFQQMRVVSNACFFVFFFLCKLIDK